MLLSRAIFIFFDYQEEVFSVWKSVKKHPRVAVTSSSQSSEPGEGGLLRRHPHLRDGLRALHPRRGHRHPLPHEDDHAEDAANAARAKALKVPPQETGNRK